MGPGPMGSSEVQTLVDDKNKLKHLLKLTRQNNQRLKKTINKLETKNQVWLKLYDTIKGYATCLITQSLLRSIPRLSFSLAINCQRPLYHEFHIRNPKYDMIRWFLVAIKSNLHHQSFQFPAHFRSAEFWNFNFQFLCLSPKDAQLNFWWSTWEKFFRYKVAGSG